MRKRGTQEGGFTITLTADSPDRLNELTQKFTSLYSGLTRIRNEGGVYFYEPHPGQVKFHSFSKKIRMAATGNRWGKTESLIVEAVCRAIGIDPITKVRRPDWNVPARIWLSSLTYKAGVEILQPKLEKLIPKSHLIKYSSQNRIYSIRDISGGVSTIGMKSADAGHDAYMGWDGDLIGLDEEHSQKIFSQCLKRLVDRRGYLIYTMTPEHGRTWTYHNVYKKGESGHKDIDIITGTMMDNPFLPQDEIALLADNLTPDEIQIALHGKWMALTGLIFAGFYHEKINCIDQMPTADRNWARCVAIDPHRRKPSAILWGMAPPYNPEEDENPRLFAYREAEIVGTPEEIAFRVRKMSGDERIDYVVIDPAEYGKQDNLLGADVKAMFDEAFGEFGIPVITWPRSPEARTTAIRSMMKPDKKNAVPGLMILRDACPTLRWQIENYSYKDVDDREGKPYSEKILKKDDDLIDCLGGMILSRPHNTATTEYTTSHPGPMCPKLGI